MRRTIYMLDATVHPNKSNLPDTLLDEVTAQAIADVQERIASGELSLHQMYELLGNPRFRHHYHRLETPYDFIQGLIRMNNEGKLVLSDSSWGKRELADKHLEGTKPGTNEMFPSSVGYNNVGGPTYDIEMTTEEITVRANIADQELDGWDTINITLVWETRTFVFHLKERTDALLDELLALIEGHLIGKFIAYTMGEFCHKIYHQTAEEILTTLQDNG